MNEWSDGGLSSLGPEREQRCQQVASAQLGRSCRLASARGKLATERAAEGSLGPAVTVELAMVASAQAEMRCEGALVIRPAAESGLARGASAHER